MQPFRFYAKLDQTLLLSLQARNAGDLLAGIRQVPESSIYHHTHRFLQRHHYLSPEPPNDFAYWMSAMINDDALSEQLASIDVIQFRTIPQIRDAFVAVLEEALRSGEKVRDCFRGEEFRFMATRTFVLETPFIARTLAEFRDVLRTVSITSLYYHMFDARLRLAQGENDFSLWFRNLGHPVLADAVSRLDPYNCTLEGLRNDIIELVGNHDTH